MNGRQPTTRQRFCAWWRNEKALINHPAFYELRPGERVKLREAWQHRLSRSGFNLVMLYVWPIAWILIMGWLVPEATGWHWLANWPGFFGGLAALFAPCFWWQLHHTPRLTNRLVAELTASDVRARWCPRCAYDLRQIDRETCPECGASRIVAGVASRGD